MAEGRLLRKTIVRDERVAQLSPDSKLLYVYAIPFLDNEGRMPGEPDAVRALCAPLERWTDLHVEHLIIEWSSTIRAGVLSPLVVQYLVDPPCRWRDEEVAMEFECRLALQFAGFARNQPKRLLGKARSSLPSPPAVAATAATVTTVTTATTATTSPPATNAPPKGSRVDAEEHGFGLKPLLVVCEDPAAAAREESSTSNGGHDDLAALIGEFTRVYNQVSPPPDEARASRLRAAIETIGLQRACLLLAERKDRAPTPPRSIVYFLEPLEQLAAACAAAPDHSAWAPSAPCPECGVGRGLHAADCPEARSPPPDVMAELGRLGREMPA